MPTRLPSFWIKATLAVVVVAAGDLLLWRADGLGLNFALFNLAWVAALILARPMLWRSRLARVAGLVAVALALLQVERPTLMGWLLFLLALGVAALAPRAHAGDDGWRWFQRLFLGGCKALIGPLFDVQRVLKARARGGPVRITIMLAGAALPVVGGIIFLSLFASANPVIGEALGDWRLPELDGGRLFLWVVVGLAVWAVLRPRGLRRTWAAPGLEGDLKLAGVGTISLTVSLGLFNLIFALQNGLDIAYLWSGAGLPKGVSFADYAHRGAYPLIATALLAGLFVLVFLRPGSATAANRTVRVLVTLWIVQNLFLVASTALRTVDYVEVYSLTRMRIAALLWMAVVATGLVLITWRLLRAKSSGWLINANLRVAGVVLVLCSVVDLGAVSAAWNTRHAREVGGAGVALDLCYMDDVDGAAIVSLAELETRLPVGDFRERVDWKRQNLTALVAKNQRDWRTWRWRDARRLARAHALFPIYTPDPWPGQRDCNGHRMPLPPKAAPPLTPTPNPGT
ncbi:MAG: DUF4173 domain-containing protein [Alphaproteobacteria bacterium]|nr:DUF4173 domain-containing protein [Alphaproteobacteria bacterium]MBU1513527.1 DUF4173 domain-containing protein [Alphaproteobacteria bacterium]MBU2094828.1 DUF4173 domain-containing protein [Alphaproteobacteria bacterium]MBU2151085.1 DUF4173 domain-containing protein [Alphaproteobacteria bacterium]MBU2309368.1 DUF4173 domain-containing protein [Alphaproteobacteria bacterium]